MRKYTYTNIISMQVKCTEDPEIYRRDTQKIHRRDIQKRYTEDEEHIHVWGERKKLLVDWVWEYGIDT